MRGQADARTPWQATFRDFGLGLFISVFLSPKSDISMIFCMISRKETVEIRLNSLKRGVEAHKVAISWVEACQLDAEIEEVSGFGRNKLGRRQIGPKSLK